MSFNRDNITWQRSDDTWAIGFWDYITTGDDPEWDVEYTHDAFWWTKDGFATPEAAMDAYHSSHSNSGGTTILPYSPEAEDEIRHLERIAGRP